MHILDQNNNKLFTGSRLACKQYIRKNRISRYKLTEKFDEKVKAFEPVEITITEETKKEGFFNKIFG